MIVDNNKQSSSNDTSASSRSSNGSFKRKESVSLSTTSTTEKLSPGVKSWSVGSSLGLVSSGHAQLDKLIGGGFALGSVCIQEIDNYSDYGRTLLYYNICESLSNGHTTLIILPNRKVGYCSAYYLLLLFCLLFIIFCMYYFILDINKFILYS